MIATSGLLANPAGGAHSAPPDPLASLRGPTSKGKGRERREKGKERNSIYIALFCTKVHTKRSGMDHTVLPANNKHHACLSFVAFTRCRHHSN